MKPWTMGREKKDEYALRQQGKVMCVKMTSRTPHAMQTVHAIMH